MCITPNLTNIAMTFIWQSSACSLYKASHSRSTISCYTNELMSTVWCKYIHCFNNETILVCSSLTFTHWMMLLQVRAKIVASPWVDEVFEIGDPFSLFLNIFIFLAKLMAEQAQHTCHLTCRWITCWKLQAHTSMSNLIGMPWFYFVVLAWCFNVLSLNAGSGAQQLQNFSTTRILQNCVTCGWCGISFSGQFWILNLGFDLKISLWSENKEAWSYLIGRTFQTN